MFSTPSSFQRHALALAASACAALAPTWAAAQSTVANVAVTPPSAATETIVITGNPLGRERGAAPVSVLSGEGLMLRRASTLGETLDGLPGVSASYFGPNASRPVIRGLDGDRLRLLDNGGASIDASNLSFDHAVSSDPLVAERVEVLRGPAALLYGGNATGGVVNSIDNRIPRVAADGLSGRAEVRLGGAAAERSGAAVVEGGGKGFAWHADAFGRDSDDLRVPRFTPQEGDELLDPTTHVRNSAARAQGGAVGAGWVGDAGFAGAAVDTYRNRYGVTAEPDVVIRMQRDRLALGGELKRLTGPLTEISAHGSHTRYQHEEVEGSGEVGTTFKSQGNELRVTARHAPLAGLEGVFGVQAETLSFEALGEEAFVPGTRTRSQAAFVLEEMQAGPLALSAGARVERVRVASDGDAAGAEQTRFGSPGERSFTPKSVSLGAQAALGAGWLANASFGRTERAPAYYELFANGLHVATGAYERGDTGLPSESSRHVEFGLAWKQGAHHLSASLFRTNFSRFISLDATGSDIVAPGEGGDADSAVPEYQFRAVRARLQGLEVDARFRLTERPWALDLTGGVDTVRGDDLDSGEPLPRLPPVRARVGLEASLDGLRAGLTVRHAAEQSRVPSTDRATAGWTMLDLAMSGPLPGVASGALWFAKLANATDELAYNAGSIEALRGLSPLPGRALSAGVQLRF